MPSGRVHMRLFAHANREINLLLTSEENSIFRAAYGSSQDDAYVKCYEARELMKTLHEHGTFYLECLDGPIADSLGKDIGKHTFDVKMAQIHEILNRHQPA